MPAELLIASSVIGGLLNAFGSAEEERNRKRKYDQLISTLEHNKIDEREKLGKLDKLGDLFNTQLMSTLNDSSVGLAIGGSANPDAIKSQITSKGLSQRAAALYSADESIDEYNRSMSEKIALARMEQEGNGTSPVLDFLKGGIQGLNIGLSLENYSAVMDENRRNEAYYNNWMENNSTPRGFGKDIGETITNDPFTIPKEKLTSTNYFRTSGLIEMK